MNTSVISKKSVLIRVDYNVPIKNGKILDLTRIKSSIPTIKYCLERNMKITLMSHLGRPSNRDKNFSLRQILGPLEKILGEKIEFIPNIKSGINKPSGMDSVKTRIRLLENLRFYPGEKNNEIEFSKLLSDYGEIYINDAFGVSHRKHASVSRIHKFFPNKKYKGLLLELELKELKKLRTNPKNPYTVIIGGAKIGSKIHMLKAFLNIADNILIGGGMAFPFIKYLGGKIGDSIYKKEELNIVKAFLEDAKKSKTNVLLPVDCLITKNIDSKAPPLIANIMNIPNKYMGVDIGKKTIRLFNNTIKKSKSIMWNGPMGISEIEKFENGTKLLAKTISRITQSGTYSLIGGGDTISDINRFGLKNQFTHVSTGGGAMLEFFKTEQLPGVEGLEAIKK